MFEAAGPPLVMRGKGALGKLLVSDDDFGALTESDEVDGDQRLAVLGECRDPGEREACGPIDGAIHALVHDGPRSPLHGDLVAAADARLHLSYRTLDGARAHPQRQCLRIEPGVEKIFGRCRDRAAYNHSGGGEGGIHLRFLFLLVT